MKHIRTASKLGLVGIGTLLMSGLVVAQSPGGDHDPLAEFVFPPELILQNERRLGLDHDQRARIREAIQTAQKSFLDLQWELQEGMDGMVALLEQEPTDEEAVLSHLDRVLAIEHRMKRAQLGLLIHLKNQLTADQRAELRRLRDPRR